MAGGVSTADLKKRQTSVLFALLTAADSVVEMLFKARAAEILLASRQLCEEGLNRDAVLLLVEEDAGFLPRSRIWALIQSMPLLKEQDGLYRLRERIFLNDFRRAGEQTLPRALRSVSWSLDEAMSVFFPVEDYPWTLRDVRDAIHKGYSWLLWTLGYGMVSGNQLETLPAFWECGQAEDTPIGNRRAVTSIGDTLGALADSHFFVCSIAALPGNHSAAFNEGLKQLLRHRVESDLPSERDEAARNWNYEGFLPYDDQPQAAYPTVDATWDAVLALSSLYDQYDRLSDAYGLIETPRDTVGAALLGGVKFLLRMQLPSGGWGIYRYLEDSPLVPAHEFTTAQTILALCLVLVTTVCEDQGNAALRAATEAALRRAWGFLQNRSVAFEGLAVWVPFFGDTPDTHTPQDLLRATVWTGTGLLALYRRFEDLRTKVTLLLHDLVALAERHWHPDYKRIADFEFRVPLKDRLNDTFGKWSNRYDVTAVVLLLDLFNESCAGDGLPLSFTSGLWDTLERTLGQILKEQHPKHGHWNEPTEGLPLAAATAMAIQALQYYLIAAGHLARQPDVPPPQV